MFDVQLSAWKIFPSADTFTPENPHSKTRSISRLGLVIRVRSFDVKSVGVDATIKRIKQLFEQEVLLSPALRPTR